MQKSICSLKRCYIAVLFFLIALNAKPQTYCNIYMGNYIGSHGLQVPYCSCDTIKLIPPAGTVSINWHVDYSQPYFFNGDTMLLLSGYTGMVSGNFNGTFINIDIFHADDLITPVLSNIDRYNLRHGNNYS
ncbi:MAG: hypothetical protein BWY70_00054 [Bacteroidetes bacterium ADurb.Bin408]|nr:MAG: hypothetical protein BWY70_00054 [Bacteroidetes bacterium ADurb.Bin408]